MKSKITEERLAFIKQSAESGMITNSQLARMMGISQPTLYRVLKSTDFADYKQKLSENYDRYQSKKALVTDLPPPVEDEEVELPSDVVTELRRIAEAIESFVEEIKK